MPQDQTVPTTNSNIVIPKVLGNVATDHTNNPANSSDIVFPGFDTNSSTLPPNVLMYRNRKVLEDSDLYKGAAPDKKIAYQTWFFNKYVKPAWQAQKYEGTIYDYLKERGTVLKTGQAPPVTTSETVGRDLQKFASGTAHTLITQVKTLDEVAHEAKEQFKQTKAAIGLGASLLKLNPNTANFVVPSLFNDAHLAVDTRAAKRSEALDQLYKADEWNMNSIYQNTTKDKLLRSGGEFTGLVPTFVATDGILGGLGVDELLGVKALKGVKGLGAKAIYNGAQGYLVGTTLTSDPKEDPNKDAIGFAAGTVLFDPAMLYLGKMFGWGGGKLINGVASYVGKKVEAKAPEATVSIVTSTLAGTQKQKISAATIHALNDLTNGGFVKAPLAMQKVALDKLSKAAPELAEQIGFIDKSVTAFEAAQNTIKQRQLIPEFDNILKELEAIDKTPTHISIATSVEDKERIQALYKSRDKWVQEVFKERGTPDPLASASATEKENISKVITERRSTQRPTVPGAASLTSLEFEQNLSHRVDTQLAKLGIGKDKYVFEDRKHKFLFYLNALMSENQKLGASKERNKEFQFLLGKLQEMYPGDEGRLPNLLTMSDAIWTKIENLHKAGIAKEGSPTRIWRQTELRPGESPFSHEVDLLQQAAKYDDAIAQSERLAEAVKRSSQGDTNYHRVALEKLFPGKTMADLDSKQFSQLNQEAQRLKSGTKQLVKNASGESSASQEAINRVKMEQSKGIKYFRKDSRTGKEIPLIGVDAIDAKAGDYDTIIRRTAEGHEVIMDQGKKAK